MIWQLLLNIILVAIRSTVAMSSQEALPIAKPRCVDSCGDVGIPYPFGIGASCAHNPWFEIVCNKSFNPEKPFLSRLKLEVVYIMEMYGPTIQVRTPPQYLCTGTQQQQQLIRSVDLRGSPYRFSVDYNKFMAIGCAGNVVLMNRRHELLALCASSVCLNATVEEEGPWIDGCTTSIAIADSGLDFYQIGFDNAVHNLNTCTMAALATNFLVQGVSNSELFYTLLEWNITDLPIESPSYQNSNCSVDERNWNMLTCECKEFHEGNPYLPNGCQVAQECVKCKGHCTRYPWETRYKCEKRL